MISWLMNGLVDWIAARVVDILGGVLSYLSSGMFLSPDVTVFPQVTAIAAKSMYVVNTCYVLAIITAGIIVMVGGTVQTRYGLKELAPRLVVAFILSNVAVPLCSVVITTANAITTAMTGPSAPTTQAVRAARAHVTAAVSDPVTALIAIVLGFVIVFLMFTLVLTWIGRIGILLVLAGIAPLAMGCFCLPYTEPVAHLWWRSLLGCVAVPTAQAIAFSTGVHVLLDPDANIQTRAGLPGGDIINLLIVLCLLWATVRIPAMMRRYVTRQGATNIGGIIARTVAIQAVSRVVPIPGRRR